MNFNFFAGTPFPSSVKHTRLSNLVFVRLSAISHELHYLG